VAEVDDHLGPDILSDATQLDFNDIVQTELLSADGEVRHARRSGELNKMLRAIAGAFGTMSGPFPGEGPADSDRSAHKPAQNPAAQGPDPRDAATVKR